MGDSIRNCRVCGRVYMHINGPQLCENCRETLDDIYFRARDEIRNAPKGEKFDNLKLSERLDVDPVFIQILVEEGLFDKEEAWQDDPVSRKNLADQFAKELEKMKDRGSSEQSASRGMFINERRGRR